MAGRARHNALKAELERRTRDLFDDDPNASHLDFVCEWIECGQTGRELAASIQIGHEVTYARLLAYLRECFGEQLTEERLDASRLRASHQMAEMALELVDATAYTAVDVARAASRARTRQWLAERWNPQQYGQQKGVNVTLNVATIHLDALRTVTGASNPQLGSGTVAITGGAEVTPLAPGQVQVVGTQAHD